MNKVGWIVGAVIGCLASTHVFADESKAGLAGYCSIGGEVIVTTDPITKHMYPSDNYTTIECRYTNRQVAKVALCKNHAGTYTSADYDTIWESIKRGWSNDMRDWTRERREDYWKFYEGVSIQSCGGE